MKVLVDVNVFEDVFRQRDGWQASAAVLSAISKGEGEGVVSALTPAILYFFVGGLVERKRLAPPCKASSAS